MLKYESFKGQQFLSESGKKLMRFKKFVGLSKNFSDFGEILLADLEAEKEKILEKNNSVDFTDAHALNRIRKILSEGEEIKEREEMSLVDDVVIYSLLYIKSLYGHNISNSLRVVESVIFEVDGSLYMYPAFGVNNSHFPSPNTSFSSSKQTLSNYFQTKYISEADAPLSAKETFIAQNSFPFFSRESLTNSDKFSFELPYAHKKDNSEEKEEAGGSQRGGQIDNNSTLIVNLNYDASHTVSDLYVLSISDKVLKAHIYDYQFPGVSFVTTLGNDEVLYNFPCYYLIKLYQMGNSQYRENNNNFTWDIYNISDINSCIRYSKAKERMNSLMGVGDPDNKELARKIRIKLYSTSSINKIIKLLGQSNINASFKILYLKLPQKSALIYSDENPTDFEFGGYQLGLYLFKDLSNSKLDINTVYFKFYCFIVFELFIYLVIWILLSVYIILASPRVINIIFRPIENLIELFKNFNMNKNFDIDKTTSEMNYKYDSDINALFLLCKQMLLGRFVRSYNDGERALAMQKKGFGVKMRETYNNISYIKSNNLMDVERMDEDKFILKEKEILDENKDEIIKMIDGGEKQYKIEIGGMKYKEEEYFDQFFSDF